MKDITGLHMKAFFDVHFWPEKNHGNLFSYCRSVSSEVSSDLIIQVKGSRYLLHKVKSVWNLLGY